MRYWLDNYYSAKAQWRPICMMDIRFQRWSFDAARYREALRRELYTSNEAPIGA